MMTMSKCNVIQRLRTSLVLFYLIFSGAVAAGETIACEEGEKPCNDNRTCYSEDDLCDNIPDCFDKTDELGCEKSCSDGEFYCEADNECISLTYRCDGEKDCTDGSDEEPCENVTCSLEGEFLCVTDKMCVDGSLRCDGTAHCYDGSDEVGCAGAANDTSGCDSESSYDCKRDGSECIELSLLCDGHRNCRDGEDEDDPSCSDNSTSPCTVNNGGCSHECIENEHGHHCECPDGLRLSYDHKSCDDINECDHHACSHDCKNDFGGYECECRKGYHLAKDQHGCLADGEEPELWLTNGSSLVQYKLHSHDRKITNLGGLLHGFAYGYRSEKIFWIDSVKKVIYWSNKDASNPEVLVDKMKDVPAALAYDWVHNNLYWADAGHHVKIEVVTLEHKWRTVIVRPPEVDHPKALIVDPRSDEGYVYWTQGGDSPVIRRAGLDGSEAVTIVSTDIGAVYALTLDVVEDRLFWVDSRLNIVESLGLDLTGREVLTTFTEYPKLPMGIDVFEDSVYWADSEAKEVFQMNKYRTEGEEKPTVTSIFQNLTIPKTVVIFHEMRQPEDRSYCGENNGGCSHICLPSPHFIKFHCVCPMSIVKTQQFIPDPDNTSSCLLSDGASSSSTPRPRNSTAAGAFAHSSDVSSSASMHTATIFKALSPSGQLTTSSWEGEGKTGENTDNLWLHIGIGGAVGLILVLLLSLIGYKLYSRHVAKNLHFDNPVFEQKPLRSSVRQADSRA